LSDDHYHLLLAARRELLVHRAQQQRRQLARAAAPLARACAWVERGFGLWHALRGHPWLVLAPPLVLLWWRPRAVLRALAGGVSLWRAGRSAQRAFSARRSS
jgi:YqjK-like protein